MAVRPTAGVGGAEVYLLQVLEEERFGPVLTHGLTECWRQRKSCESCLSSDQPPPHPPPPRFLPPQFYKRDNEAELVCGWLSSRSGLDAVTGF